MSFFQSLKEDLSEAVNDLIADEDDGIQLIDRDDKETLHDIFSDGSSLASDDLLADIPEESFEETVEDASVRSALDSLKNASKRYEQEQNMMETDLDALIKSLSEQSEEVGTEEIDTREIGIEETSAEENSISDGQEETAEAAVEASEEAAKNKRTSKKKAKEEDEEPVQLEFDLDALLSSLEEGNVEEEAPVEEKAEESESSDDVLDDLMREYKEKLQIEDESTETISEEIANIEMAEEKIVAEENTEEASTEDMNPGSLIDSMFFSGAVENTEIKDASEETEESTEPEITDEVISQVVIEESNEIVEPKTSDAEKNIEEKIAESIERQKSSAIYVETVKLEEQEISDETAVIAEGMKVVGNIESTGNINLAGEIIGNVNLLGKFDITGKLTGNTRAFELFADAAKINGDIITNGSVKLGQGTVVIGDIKGASAVIAGAVKGDIDVHGPVILDSSAIVMGNIKSMSVQINNGAIIEGLCSQCYAEVNPTAFFEDFKKEK